MKRPACDETVQFVRNHKRCCSAARCGCGIFWSLPCCWLSHTSSCPQVRACSSWNIGCTSNTLLRRCGSTFGFRSSDSMSDADWCYNDIITAPLFARLRQLHSLKRRLLSHPEHCPNSMDSVTNVLIHWCMLVVLDRHVGHPHNHLDCCFGCQSVQITIPHLFLSHKLTSTCTLECAPSVPCSSMETPSTVAALLLFQWSHSFSFSGLIGGDTRCPTHGLLIGDTLLLFSSSRRHTPSSVCCCLETCSTSLPDTRGTR